MTAADINSALHRQVRTGTIYDAFMPPSDCSSKKLGNGDTAFALKHMAKTALKYQHQTRTLTTKFFSGISLLSLCNELHQFLFWHFQYAIDGDKQLLRSPACSWVSRFEGIDCKSYSIFASTVLLNAGVRHYMRRIVQASNPNAFTHVYIVVPKNQTTGSLSSGYYVIDGTINTMQELPFLRKDDLQVGASSTPSASPISTLGAASVALVPPYNVSTPTSAYHTFNNIIAQLQAQYPYNNDLQQLQQAVQQAIAQQRTNIPIRIIGFSVLFAGKVYHLVPMPTGLGNADTVETTDLVNMTAQQAQAFVAQQAEAIKQQTNNIIGTVSDVVGTVASLFGPVGQLVGIVVKAVAMVASLLVLFAWNPCSGAEYNPEDIRFRLQRDFVASFEQVANNLDRKLQLGTFVSASYDLSLLLKEIDLGVAQYEEEVRHFADDPCNIAALYAFKDFVSSIKATADNFYNALKIVCKSHFKFTETKEWGSTTERSWYFIVPVSTRPRRFQYRRVAISRWNENLRTMYPYGDPKSFLAWLDTNVAYLNTMYKDRRGDRYKQDMLPFKSQIEAIRADLDLSAVFRWDKEEALRKRQYQIYLRYDDEYKKSLELNAKNEMQAFKMRTQAFLDEIKTIQHKVINKGRKIYNHKQLINLALIGTISIAAAIMLKK